MTKFVEGLYSSAAVIYFVASPAANSVKIGFTKNAVERRLSAIRMYSPLPLELVGTIPGSQAVEAALHAKFRSNHLHNEWFVLEGPLRRFLGALALGDEPTVAAVVREAVYEAQGIDHGSLSCYVGRKCRCERCVQAYSAYQKERRHTYPVVPTQCTPDKTVQCPSCGCLRAVTEFGPRWRPGGRGRPPQCFSCKHDHALVSHG